MTRDSRRLNNRVSIRKQFCTDRHALDQCKKATANLWYKSFRLNLEPQFRLRTADVPVRNSLVTDARISRSRLHRSSEKSDSKYTDIVTSALLITLLLTVKKLILV